MDIKSVIKNIECGASGEFYFVTPDEWQILKSMALAQQPNNKKSTPCEYHEWLRLGKKYTAFIWCPYCHEAL
jgi:hypothetical protein